MAQDMRAKDSIMICVTGLHVDKRRHWQVSDQPGLDIRLCSIPWFMFCVRE